jgi:DNA-binding transcriptional LysR family regulator
MSGATYCSKERTCGAGSLQPTTVPRAACAKQLAGRRIRSTSMTSPPTSDPIDLNDLVYFAHVIEHGGYSAAEKALGIPRSRLSRRLSGLESRLGVRLLQRSTRRLSLTEAGELFLKHCRAVLADAQTGIEEISQLQASPRGKVRVSCPPIASRVVLAPLLPEFLKRYPEVRVEVRVTNRVVDLYEDGIDVSLRVGTAIDETGGVIAKLIWRAPQRLVAAPALLKRHGLPAAPEKLSLFPTLDSVVQQGRYVWKLVAPDGHQLEHQHQPRLVSDDMEILRQTALAGLGVVRLPETMCKADLAAGKLSIVLPDWSVSPNLLYATYLSRRGLMPAVRHFIDFLSAPLGESPASEKKGTK